MVIGRDRDPSDTEADIHFIYTVEFFDGDVKENIVENDIAYISPEEARENMRELEEEQEEELSHSQEEDDEETVEGEDREDREGERGDEREGDRDEVDSQDPIFIDREEDDEEEEEEDEEEEDFIDNDDTNGYNSKGEDSVSGDSSRKRNGGAETPDMPSSDEEEEDEVELSSIVHEDKKVVVEIEDEEVDSKEGNKEEPEEEANAMAADEDIMSRRMAEDSLRISSDLRLSSDSRPNSSRSNSRGPSEDHADLSALTEAEADANSQYDVTDDETAELLSAQAMQKMLGQNTKSPMKQSTIVEELETASSTASSNTSSSPRRASASAAILSSSLIPEEGSVSGQSNQTTPVKRHSTGSLPRDHESEDGPVSTPTRDNHTPLKSPLSAQSSFDSMDSNNSNDPVAQAMKAYRRLSSRSPAPNHGNGLRKSIDTLLRNSNDDNLMQSPGPAGNGDSGGESTSSPGGDVNNQFGGSVESPTDANEPHHSSKGEVLQTGLPEGWAEVITEDGSPYYWHKATNEVTWDKPKKKGTRGPSTKLFQPVDEDLIIEHAEGEEGGVEGEEGEEGEEEYAAYAEGEYAEGELSEGPYLSEEDPQALSTVEEGDECESMSRVHTDDFDFDDSVLGRATPEVFEESDEEEKGGEGGDKEGKEYENVVEDMDGYGDNEGSHHTEEEGSQSGASLNISIRSESFGRNSDGGELEQEHVDQMVDFLTHAGLEGYAEEFMHYGFG